MSNVMAPGLPQFSNGIRDAPHGIMNFAGLLVQCRDPPLMTMLSPVRVRSGFAQNA
jgi:hypothetical protein